MTDAVTIYDRLKNEYVEGSNVLIAQKRGETSARVTDGMKPRKPAITEGLQTLAPEELLTLRINELSVNGAVRGYQRPYDPRHARKAARALREGKPFPPIIVAVNGRGQLEVVEGQHRACAGVIARIPVEAVIKRMDAATRQALFTGQRHAKRVDPNVLTLTDTGPFQRYVQEAVSTAGHPWSDIVSANRTSKTRIGPYAMFQLLVRYVGNVEGTGSGVAGKGVFDDRWDRGLADELAPLIAAFGNKQIHPLAFRPWTLQAIGASAMWVFRRHEPLIEDRERWARHMPTFPFDHYLFIRTQQDMTDRLVDHWNKRLSAGRRVVRA